MFSLASHSFNCLFSSLLCFFSSLRLFSLRNSLSQAFLQIMTPLLKQKMPLLRNTTSRLWAIGKRGYAAGTAQPDGIKEGVAYSLLLKKTPEDALRNPELAHMSAIDSKNKCLVSNFSIFSRFNQRRDDKNEPFPGRQRCYVDCLDDR